MMGNAMNENIPFKIRVTPDGKYFDDELYTHLEDDVLYVKVADHPIETAIKLLTEQGYDISMNAYKKPNDGD